MALDREIEAILLGELNMAQLNHENAKREFWHIAADIPSGLPHPDGAQRVSNAARAQSVAREAHVVALERLNNFLKTGEVPKHLQDRIRGTSLKRFPATTDS